MPDCPSRYNISGSSFLLLCCTFPIKNIFLEYTWVLQFQVLRNTYLIFMKHITCINMFFIRETSLQYINKTSTTVNTFLILYSKHHMCKLLNCNLTDLLKYLVTYLFLKEMFPLWVKWAIYNFHFRRIHAKEKATQLGFGSQNSKNPEQFTGSRGAQGTFCLEKASSYPHKKSCSSEGLRPVAILALKTQS